MKKLLCIIACLLSLSLTMKAQPGTLDAGFGDNGKVLNDAFTGECLAVALQEDGKIVTGGFYDSYNNNERGFIISRFNTDGSIDNGFGGNGKIIITEFEGNRPTVFVTLSVQKDGKIIICGIVKENTGDQYNNIGIARLNTDGSLDNTFSGNGILVINPGINDLPGDMTLQVDGKIVITGFKGLQEGQGKQLFTMRILTNGDLDKSFGENGMVLFVSTFPAYNVKAIAVQADNKILVAGKYYGGSFYVIRFLQDGAIDNSFDEEKDGITGIRFDEADLYSADLYDMTVQQDGKIVVAGTAGTNTTVMMALARFTSNGSIDSAFGTKTGYSVLQMQKNRSSAATTVNIEADQKIVLTGFYENKDIDGFAAVKYNYDGSLDSSFGNNGVAAEGFDTLRIFDAGAGTLQKDGKIIVAGFGYTSRDNDFTHIALVRYNNDAILPIIYSKFAATQTKEYITLNWQTTTELNNKYFAVERSNNAVNYTAVAQVNSVATGAAVQDYAYTDKLPLAGTNYYRLKQVDKDGKFSYSKTINISYLKPGSIQLFPNPAKDKLTVKGLNAAIISTIAVLDIQGKQLLQFTAKAASYSFSIGSLAPGTYMVRVKDSNGTAVEKFVKQ